MKKIFFTVFCCFFITCSMAKADNLINRAYHSPASVEKNKYMLVQYLTKNIEDDYDKLKVIAYWIASHIAYDDYKYNTQSGVNLKELRYEYDILAKKSGICGDFAQLFADMASIARAGRVSVVSGYVLENVHILKRKYSRREVSNLTGHAWNLVELGNRKFFVDTTFMARSTLRHDNRKRVSSLKHRHDLQKRGHSHDVNTNVNDFYFDFTPKSEIKTYKSLHLQSKYIR